MENIKQYDTPVFRHPTIEEIKTLNVVSHIWKTGDRYFKLADQYYDDPEMWWVIALYNQKPTEFQLKLGDIVFVPTPLESVLFYIGY